MKINGVNIADAGYMPEKGDKSAPVPVSDIKDYSNERIYPCMYVDSKEIPGIEKLKLGEEVLLIAKVKLVNKSENENIDRGKKTERCSGTLKILQAGFGPWKGAKPVEEMDDEELAAGETEIDDEEKEEK